MAKKEEEVVEKEYSLQELLAHSRKVDANIVADQTLQARDAVKAQWGLIDPSELANETPVVTKPATKKELAEKDKIIDQIKSELDAASTRVTELAMQNEQLLAELATLKASAAPAQSSVDAEGEAAAAAKLAEQKSESDDIPPWMQGEQK